MTLDSFSVSFGVVVKTLGIIAEFNPFHRGHLYLIEEAKKLTGSDYCVIVMSGDYVQRGAPAIFDMHKRAEMAVLSGADLVLELPVRFATASAELFAFGGVSLLDSLGIIDCIAFGSESGDLSRLKEIADILAEEPEEYRKYLRENLKEGLSFPSSREAALRKYLRVKGCKEAAHIIETLKTPNDILGIEYLKALKRLQKAEKWQYGTGNTHEISPLAIKRCPGFLSAKEIRESIEEAQKSLCLTPYSFEHKYSASPVWKQELPDTFSTLFDDKSSPFLPVCLDDFSGILHYSLISNTLDEIRGIDGISEESARRIYGKRFCFTGFSAFIESLKTKNLTYTSISRGLLRLLLRIQKLPDAGILKPDREGLLSPRLPEGQIINEKKELPLVSHLKSDRSALLSPRLPEGQIINEKKELPLGGNLEKKEGAAQASFLHALIKPEYARLLGCRKNAKELLHIVSKSASIPIISKAADYKSILPEEAWPSFEEDLKAAHIYEAVLSAKYKTVFRHECERRIFLL